MYFKMPSSYNFLQFTQFLFFEKQRMRLPVGIISFGIFSLTFNLLNHYKPLLPFCLKFAYLTLLLPQAPQQILLQFHLRVLTVNHVRGMTLNHFTFADFLLFLLSYSRREEKHLVKGAAQHRGSICASHSAIPGSNISTLENYSHEFSIIAMRKKRCLLDPLPTQKNAAK